MKLAIEANPSDEVVRAIRDGLDNFNLQHAKGYGFQTLTIILRDDEGTIKGGLLGVTAWDWCHIDILWLDESVRGERYGSQLIQLAEQEALARACIGIFVDTMSFQAPEFYKKHGYTQWGQLDDFPVGHQRLFFQKRLT